MTTPDTTATAMRFAHTLNKNEIKNLKKATAIFLRHENWQNGSKVPVTIPWNFILIPDYQEQRSLDAEVNKSIDTICSNWDENRITPGIVNLRTDGDYAGLLFIVDGYHRARSMERLSDTEGYKGALDIIINTSYDNENHVFADQYDGVSPVTTLTRFHAWLKSSDITNRNVAAAHKLNDILNKYHVDAASNKNNQNSYSKLAIGTAHNACHEDIVHGTEAFDWTMDILTSSGAAMTDMGLSRGMLLSLLGTYSMIEDGRFGGVTPADAKSVLVEKLSHHTWGTMQDLAIALRSADPVHVKWTSDLKRCKGVLSHWICEEWGLPENSV